MLPYTPLVMIPTKLNPADKGTSGGMDPRFYRKVKRSGQKGSLEKPQKLTLKLNQRKEDGSIDPGQVWTGQSGRREDW